MQARTRSVEPLNKFIELPQSTGSLKSSTGYWPTNADASQCNMKRTYPDEDATRNRFECTRRRVSDETSEAFALSPLPLPLALVPQRRLPLSEVPLDSLDASRNSRKLQRTSAKSRANIGMAKLVTKVHGCSRRLLYSPLYPGPYHKSGNPECDERLAHLGECPLFSRHLRTVDAEYNERFLALLFHKAYSLC